MSPWAQRMLNHKSPFPWLGSPSGKGTNMPFKLNDLQKTHTHTLSHTHSSRFYFQGDPVIKKITVHYQRPWNQSLSLQSLLALSFISGLSFLLYSTTSHPLSFHFTPPPSEDLLCFCLVLSWKAFGLAWELNNAIRTSDLWWFYLTFSGNLLQMVVWNWKNCNKSVFCVERNVQKQPVVTYMLPVAELLSVGREPLERSIWANLQGENTHQWLKL